MTAAEDRIVDLLAHGIQHRRIGIAVERLAVCLHGRRPVLEDIVEPTQEIGTDEVVDIENHNRIGGIFTQIGHCMVERLGFGTLFEIDRQQLDAFAAKPFERLGPELVGDHHHTIPIGGILLRRGRRKRGCDHVVALIGRNKHRKTPFLRRRGIVRRPMPQ